MCVKKKKVRSQNGDIKYATQCNNVTQFSPIFFSIYNENSNNIDNLYWIFYNP